jgi:hypothetical protein
VWHVLETECWAGDWGEGRGEGCRFLGGECSWRRGDGYEDGGPARGVWNGREVRDGHSPAAESVESNPSLVGVAALGVHFRSAPGGMGGRGADGGVLG